MTSKYGLASHHPYSTGKWKEKVKVFLWESFTQRWFNFFARKFLICISCCAWCGFLNPAFEFDFRFRGWQGLEVAFALHIQLSWVRIPPLLILLTGNNLPVNSQLRTQQPRVRFSAFLKVFLKITEEIVRFCGDLLTALLITVDRALIMSIKSI